MSGNQTNGYDIVFQLSEQAYNPDIYNTFEVNGIIYRLIESLNWPNDTPDGLANILNLQSECHIFNIELVFDIPSGSSLPANARNPVTLNINISNVVQITTIVEVDIGKAFGYETSKYDSVNLNFRDKTYVAEIVVNLPIDWVKRLIDNLSIMDASTAEILRLAFDEALNNWEELLEKLSTQSEIIKEIFDSIIPPSFRERICGCDYANQECKLIFDIKQTVQNNIPIVPLVPIPFRLHLNTIDPHLLVSADLTIIKDNSISASNVLAILFTFGGGIEGEISGFHTSSIPSGSHLLAIINHMWICRILSFYLEGINLIQCENDAQSCCLANPHMWEDKKITLTDLKLTPVNETQRKGFAVYAGMSLDDFGFKATANAEGGIYIEKREIEKQRDEEEEEQEKIYELVFVFVTPEPVIEISFDWWVWLAIILAGAALALVGGWLFGFLVGAVAPGVAATSAAAISAKLAFALTFLMAEFIREIIYDLINKKALGKINEKIKDLIEDIKLVLPSKILEMIFDSVSIDDLNLAYSIYAKNTSEVKFDKIIQLKVGQKYNLDEDGSPTVKDHKAQDIRLSDTNDGYMLITSAIARDMQLTNFNISKSELAGYYYSSPGTLMVNYNIDKIYPVRTREGRYSLIKILKLIPNGIELKMKTYKKHQYCWIEGDVVVEEKNGIREWIGIFEVIPWGMVGDLSYEWKLDNELLDLIGTIKKKGVVLNYEINENEITIKSKSEHIHIPTLELKATVKDYYDETVTNTKSFFLPPDPALLLKAIKYTDKLVNIEQEKWKLLELQKIPEFIHELPDIPEHIVDF